MDDFCGSKFWDANLTWHTNNPDLTPCFEKTVLVWVPCAFLWLTSIMDIYYSHQSKSPRIPISLLNVAKIVCTIILIAFDICILVEAIQTKGEDDKVYPVHWSAAAIKIVTYIYYILLLVYSILKGVQSSGVQFLFWLLLTVCQAFRFRTVVDDDALKSDNHLTFAVEVIYFPLCCFILFLNSWADDRPNIVNEKGKVSPDKQCPEMYASFLSKLLFHWFTAMTWKGYRKPLEPSDLWDLNKTDKSAELVPVFDVHWDKQREKSRRNRQRSTKTNENQQQSYANILPAIFGAFWATLTFAWIIRVIPDVVLAFISPQILDLLIDFATNDDPVWKGIVYALILLLSAFLSTMLTSQSTHLLYATGMRIKISLISAIYRKALLLSSAARRESSTGQIVNLMSVDVQKIMEVVSFLHYVWNVPLQIAVAIYFLWQQLGPSALAGLAVMVILLPLNALIASKSKKLQIEQMKRKDNRVKLMNEILSGIKVLKLYAWEPSFENQIMKIRQEELSILRKAAYLDAFSIFLSGSSGFLVAIASFATFILVDSNNVLDAKVAFVSMSLFNVISLGLNFLPMIVVMVVQAGVSAKRLNKFMNAEEIDPDAVTHDPTQNDPIVINRGTFLWEQDNIALDNINLSIKPGSLVAVVGSVGSGKSTLLSAILGEIHKIDGTVNTSGSIAYVAQQAWIQNDTLKGNILFGRTFDRVKYDRVVEASALKTDFDILPAGDKTEIGEKGINLSGGQKQRVSLARATYSNAEIYLFDDPLSAVDSHVGKHIFEKVIGPKGLLKKKTRVLVTHGIQYLPHVDDIIVLKDGKISERGSYKDLLRTKGAFAEFLRTHLETADDEDIEELQDGAIIQDLEGVLGDISKIPRRGSSRRASETSQGSAQRRKVSRTISELDRRDSFAESEKSLNEEDVSKLIEKEKSETKSVQFSVYSDYFRAAGWTYMACTFVFYLANQSFSVGSNVFLSSWTNRLTNEEDSDDGDGVSKGAFLAIYGSLGIAQSLVLLVGACTMTLGTLKSASNLHWRMLQRILRAPLSFFDVTPAGRILNRFARDVDVCDATLPSNFRYWLTYFFVVLSTLVVISYSTPIFVAVIVPIGVLYYFVQRFYVSTSRQLKRMESVTRSPIYSHFEETLTGATTIRAYSEQERFILDSEAKVDKNQMSYYPAIVSNRWLQVRLETVGNLIIFFAALFAVLSRDSVDAGVVGLSISYALQVTVGLNMLVRWTSDVETNIVAVERLREYADVVQEAPWEIQEMKPETSWPENGEVTFDHYQTRYRPGLDLVLRNVTCTIQPGEKVGIVGRTGAGKSSLTLALFRIVEAAGGSIAIDGRDISRLGLHDVRGRITIIPQEPALFCGTLRMNLDPFEQQKDDTIWQALELAHLKSFARSLSGGLEHEISEGGENLSVGQRQLVCLARALLKKTKILVLDEATAAVDLETDDLIQETIRKEFKDSTVITIAHRLNTIMDSDKVMVLDKGEIREFDSPANLLQDKDTIFSGMARDAGIQ